METLLERRSHLQSGSYRTLSRIFSHCLDLSLKHSTPNSDASVNILNDESQIGSSVGICDLGRKDEILQSAEESLREENNWVVGFDGNQELVDVMMSDLSSLIHDDIGELNDKDQNLSSVGELDVKTDPNQQIEGIDVPIIVNNDKLDLGREEIVSNCKLDELNEVGNSKDQILSTIGELDAKREQNQQIEAINEPIRMNNSKLDLGQEEMNPISELDQLNEVGNSKDRSLELENEIMQDESNLDKLNLGNLNNSIDVSLIGELHAQSDQNQQIEGINNTELDLGKEEIILTSKLDQLNEEQNSKDGFLGEIMQDESNLDKLNQDHLNNIISNFEDFEEGEIPDEVQDLDEELEFENKDEFLNNNKLKEDLVNTNLGFDKKEENNQGLIDEFNANNNNDEFMLSDGECDDENTHDEDLKEGKKRKRVLTEERKAKKKKAKRIKRAKKLREEGVHRLRIPLTIKKEKEKKICKFFLNGRCQQGDKCKFSHDAVPLTKSKPCNHFARGECLKGDECPYDHNLQKYPCHKFISEGFCNRGPNCKFSHKATTTVQAKEDSLSEKSKPNILKDNNNNNNIISSFKLSPVQKSIEKPTKIPKGIKFLSFKKDLIVTSEKTGKTNEGSVLPDLEKSGISNDGFCSSSSNLLKVRNEAVCGEVSEASKILQEFLFSALSPF